MMAILAFNELNAYLGQHLLCSWLILGIIKEKTKTVVNAR